MTDALPRWPEPRKFQWLDHIAVNTELAPVVFRVAYLIRCTYGDNATGRCDVAMDTIARRLDVNEKTIRRAVEQLDRCGYVEVTRRGWNHTNILLPTLPERTEMSAPVSTDERSDDDAERTFLSPRSGHQNGQECPTLPPIPTDPTDDRGEPQARPPASLSSTNRRSSSTFNGNAKGDAGASRASLPHRHQVSDRVTFWMEDAEGKGDVLEVHSDHLVVDFNRQRVKVELDLKGRVTGSAEFLRGGAE
ncbi:MAG: hypothetical protein EOQ28_04225 [Mesorhizobium sp.]|uniref:hypothetical protein n=1 Tax=Mesorhizobium sp. TaxID=1871066 RepID=UPI000FE92683|nr:hypothetical protein [Mesorhizobium sp.]RWA76897.1 MAG: hypothetical protein EOQ28_04225 [Mesorhizobium sp.]